MKYLCTVIVPTTLVPDLGSKPGHPPLLCLTVTCPCGMGLSMEQTGRLGQRQEQLHGHKWNNYKVFLRRFGTRLQLLGFPEGVRKITGNGVSVQNKHVIFVFLWSLHIFPFLPEPWNWALLGEGSPPGRLKHCQTHQCEISSWEGACMSQHGACRVTEYSVDDDGNEENVNHRAKKKGDHN